MVGMALAKSMYAIPTWTRTARLSRSTPRCALRSAARMPRRASERATGSLRSCARTSRCWTPAAKDAETTFALGLLDAVRERKFAVRNAIMDKG